MPRRILLAALPAALLLVPLGAAPPPLSVRFHGFVDDYYGGLFTWDPAQATAVGVHDFDAKMPDRSAENHARRGDSGGPAG